MIDVAIAGFGDLRLHHLVLDFNGTLAVDGELIPEVRPRLEALAARLDLHIVTGDTHRRAAAECRGLPCRLNILPATGQAQAKLDYIERLGADTVIAIGNGRNDRLMLERAALGIAVLGAEGSAVLAVQAADIVTRDIRVALDLLAAPLRLAATLRG